MWSRLPTLNAGTSFVSASIAQNVQTSPSVGSSSTLRCFSFFPMKPHSSSNCRKLQVHYGKLHLALREISGNYTWAEVPGFGHGNGRMEPGVPLLTSCSLQCCSVVRQSTAPYVFIFRRLRLGGRLVPGGGRRCWPCCAGQIWRWPLGRVLFDPPFRRAECFRADFGPYKS